MIIMLQNILNSLVLHPKQIFLLDGIGALVSTLFLGVILVKLEIYIGMPKSVCFVLGGMAFCYAVFSLSCYFFLKARWSPFLRIIAFANLTHILVTLFMIFKHQQSLTRLGILYFAGEIVIVFAIALLELKAVKEMR